MKLKGLALATALLLMTSLASAQTWDAVKDFTLAANPNGVWSYGSLTDYGVPLALYTTTCTNLFGLPDSAWATQGCNTPYVFRNNSSQPICFETICVPPNYFQLDIGNNGFGPFISVVRWTAPQSGTFTIYGSVEGLDWDGPTNTELHVIYNTNKEILKVVVDSYESPVEFGREMTLSSGDTIDFAVNGRDGKWNFDSTGIQFYVRQD
jgi:hypothetical protein